MNPSKTNSPSLLQELRETVKCFSHTQHGATAIEYSMIVALVTVIAIAGYRVVGGSLDALISATASDVSSTS